MPNTPVCYQPSFEQPAPDEAGTTEALGATMRSILETTSEDYGRAVRSVHAKSHALLKGELRVLPSLPESLAQGVFADALTYPVVLRFSTNPGDILDDSVSAPRGLAVKIVGVSGERLPGSESDATQDFVMINAPVFVAATPKAFLGTLKALAATTDRAQWAKKALSTVMRGVETALEAVGGESGTVKSLGGHRATNVLGETYYTGVPILYGPYMAKLCVAPVSPSLAALKDSPVTVTGRPNGLRDAATEFFAAQGGEWELRVQLCTDLEAMPIEDASELWPEDQSPYVAVARITVPQQPAWNEARSTKADEGLAFSPWHGLAAHRPIGGIMRARKPAYEMSANFRATRNGCPIHEPRSLDAILD